MKKVLTKAQVAKAEKRRSEFSNLNVQVKMMSHDELESVANDITIITIDDHPLSPTNKVLLTYQRADVTTVGGFQQWRKHGRSVKKGEHGLSIWFPSVKKEKEPAKEEEKKEVFFLMGTVFDISQTEVAKEQPNA